MSQWVEDRVLHLEVDLFEGSQSFDLSLSVSSKDFDVELVGGGSGRLPYYTGEYVVDPRKVEQILETRNKSMREDVTINPIFYAETSNTSGGLTAVIGLE
jgi:hypothetical protein